MTADPLTPELHTPVIVTDGGPWAIHDHACSTCQSNKSVLDLSQGRFAPCWTCVDAGWLTVRARGRVRRWLIRKLANEQVLR